MKRTFNLIKQRILDSRQRMTLLLVSMFITLSSWAEVSGHYNSPTKTLSFIGYGTITSQIVKGIAGYDQATEILIGCGVTKIDNYAFVGCTNVNTLVLQAEDLELEIGQNAFYGCPIETFSYYRNFTYAGNAAYSGERIGLCYNNREVLKTVTIGPKVTNIPNYTFNYCTKLTNVNLENATGLTAIPVKCFANCAALASISIPSSVSSIGYRAFENCAALASISIPSSVSSIGDGAFSGCAALASISIPSSVSSIGDGAFSGCAALASISIPGNVSSIGNCAFSSCSNIKTLELSESDGILEIGLNAFVGCPIETFSYYRNFTYAGNADYFGERIGLCYNNREVLKTVTIGPKVTNIPNYTFNYCTKLTNVNLENATGLTAIPVKCFANCAALASISIPSSVSTIGYRAFENCAALATISIPSSVSTIGDGAFSGCAALASISIPRSVSNIGGCAFSNCTNLKTLELSESDGILEIGHNAFYGCPIETFSYYRNFTYAGNDFSYAQENNALCYNNRKVLKTVTIGPKVTNIPNYTFYGCENLTDVSILNNTLSSYDYSEQKNLADVFPSVVHLTFGEQVSSIGEYAFYDSPYLEDVLLLKSNTTYKSTSFEKCPKLNNIHLAEQKVSNGLFMCYNLMTKALIIRAEGDAVAMPDYSNSTQSGYAPWKEYRSKTEHLVLEGNITCIGSFAFKDFNLMKDIEFKDAALTSIHENAFDNCNKLVNINFPSSLTEIKQYALRDCKSLTALNFKETELASIGTYAFQNNIKLAEVILPSTCNTIGGNAFNGCSNIQDVICYSWPTSVGSYLFDNALQTSATLYYTPNSVSGSSHPLASYFKEAKNAATALSCGPYLTYSIANGVLTITSSADEPVSTYDYESSESTPWADQASSITKVVVSGKVLRLGNHIFSDLTNLTEVDMSQAEGFTTIANYVFANCEKLATINLPASIQEIGEYAFCNCESITQAILPTAMSTIKAWAFSGTGITTLSIPSSVKVIEEKAFCDCRNLTSLTLPEGLNYIGKYAFDGCSLLEELVIPRDYNVIDPYAFANTGIKSLTLNSSVIEIGDHAFYDCSQLEEVFTYGNSKLEKIGTAAFSLDTKLKTFYMPGRVREICDYAFNGCALEEVEFSDLLTKLGDNAFYGCNLTSIEIPSSLTEIGSSAFAHNAQLQVVILPSTLERINDGAFSRCEALSNIVLSDSLKLLGTEAFYGCKSLKDIVIPAGVTDIARYTFCESGLQSVTLPDSLLTIGYGAFKDCNELHSITLPRTLESIDEYAFSGCNMLKTIEALPMTPPTLANRNVFNEGVYDQVTGLMYVYTACADTYKSAPIWSELGSHIVNPYYGYCGENMMYQIEEIEGGYVLKLQAYEGGSDQTTLWDCTADTGANWITNSITSQLVPQIIRVEIDNSLTSIGSYALANLTAVETLEIPASVTAIGTGAFAGCTSLKEIYLNNPVPTTNGTGVADANVYSNAIVYSSEPKEFNNSTIWCKFGTANILPYYTGYCGKKYSAEECSVTYAQEGKTMCFTVKGHELKIWSPLSGWDFMDLGLDHLEMADFPNYNENPWYKYRNYIQSVSWERLYGMTKIGNTAFYSLQKLTEIEIPESVETIGRTAFMYSGLQSIVIPEGVKTIQGYAFYGSSSLKSVVLPNSLQTIESQAFARTAIEEIEVPYGITNLNSYTFTNCTALKHVTLPYRLTYLYNNVFAGCTSLEEIVIPDRVETIFNSCFLGCTKLKNINIPSSVKNIKYNAFENCTSLESINIPSQITELGKNIFTGCTSLNSLHVERITPLTLTEGDNNPFNGLNTTSDGKYDVTLYVPRGTVEAYSAAAVWQNFTIQEEGVVNLVDGQAYSNTEDIFCSEIRYSRTFSAKQANTWQATFLPFSYDVEDYLNDFDIAEIYAICPISDTNGNGMLDAGDQIVMIVNKKQTGKTFPNVPYLIRPKASNTYTITTSNDYLYKAEYHPVEFATSITSYTVNGIYESDFYSNPGENNYYISASGLLTCPATKSTNVKPHRWYMHKEDNEYANYEEDNNSSSAPIRILAIGEDLDEETAISLISGDSISTNKTNSYFFNLNGIRVEDSNELPSGIYIKNGKKIYIQ